VVGLLVLGGAWLQKGSAESATGRPEASSPSQPPAPDAEPRGATLAANAPVHANDPAHAVSSDSPGSAKNLGAELRGGASPGRPEPAPRVAAAQKVADVRAAELRHPAGPARSAEEPAPTGVFAVGGELLLGGEVFIDGKARGFAPGRFELPVGTHRVEVLTRDGTRHGPREFKVTRQHTQSSALQWQE
jgi:hypothetical protein